MNTSLHRSSILKKTMQIGWATLASRLLGLIREVLQGKYLGATVLADVFVTAFKIPNSLRKIFAEGALSVVLVPVFVKLYPPDDDKRAINSLMTLSFLIFEGILILLCFWIFWQADVVIRFIAPGWYSYQLPAVAQGLWGQVAHVGQWLAMIFNPSTYHMEPGPQVVYAIRFLRILISFIVFISSSALLSGALQSVNHFFVPSISPVFINIVWIIGLVLGIVYGLSVEYLCFFILFAGLLQFLLHLMVYFYLGFHFGPIDGQSWKNMRFVAQKFLPCVVSMSFAEINLFIDTSFASYLPSGSMMIIYLANRFVGIPQGVFGVAFSTVLLPHFSRVSLRAPKRLSFYLFEATKLVFWVTLPVMFIMGLWSYKIFYTLFLSKKFAISKITEASYVMMAFLLGLCFLALNKILLNLFYALHETRIPAIITLVAIGVNLVVNFMWLELFKATGLALATTLSVMVQTVLYLFFLHKKFNFNLYIDRLLQFIGRYMFQLTMIGIPFYGIYRLLTKLIELLPVSIADFLLLHIGFWLWALPLAVGGMFAVYVSRKYFGIRLYFLD